MSPNTMPSAPSESPARLPWTAARGNEPASALAGACEASDISAVSRVRPATVGRESRDHVLLFHRRLVRLFVRCARVHGIGSSGDGLRFLSPYLGTAAS